MMREKIILIVVLLLILSTLFIIIDSKLFYYGKSNYNATQCSLPLDMEPDFWGTDVCYPEMGFLIIDKYGLVVLGRDSYFLNKNDTIKVRQILKYGICQDTLIALIEGNKSFNYYLKYSNNNLLQSKNELVFKVLNTNVEFAEDYKWFDLISDKRKISTLIMLREYSGLGIIITIIASLIFSAFWRKSKH